MAKHGHKHYGVESIQRVKGGFDVVRGGNIYQVRGGKASGGSRSDWFVTGGILGNDPVWCQSVADALRMLETA